MSNAERCNLQQTFVQLRVTHTEREAQVRPLRFVQLWQPVNRTSVEGFSSSVRSWIVFVLYSSETQCCHGKRAVSVRSLFTLFVNIFFFFVYIFSFPPSHNYLNAFMSFKARRIQSTGTLHVTVTQSSCFFDGALFLFSELKEVKFHRHHRGRQRLELHWLWSSWGYFFIFYLLFLCPLSRYRLRPIPRRRPKARPNLTRCKARSTR